MISLPACQPWEVLVRTEDLEEAVVIMAPTRSKAHLAAQELYRGTFVKVVGVAPDWNDAA